MPLAIALKPRDVSALEGTGRKPIPMQFLMFHKRRAENSEKVQTPKAEKQSSASGNNDEKPKGSGFKKAGN